MLATSSNTSDSKQTQQNHQENKPTNPNALRLPYSSAQASSTETGTSFPIRTKQTTRTLKDTRTEVLVSFFTDRVLVLVTQFGKVGSLLFTTVDPITSTTSHLDLEDVMQDTTLPPAPATTTRFLLGQSSGWRSHVQQLYASQIAILVNTPTFGSEQDESFALPSISSRGLPVVVGLALRNGVERGGEMAGGYAGDEVDEAVMIDRELFRGVMDMVKECL